MRLTWIIFGVSLCFARFAISQEIVGHRPTPIELVNQLCLSYDERELAAGPDANFLREARRERIRAQLIAAGTNCWPAVAALVASISYPDDGVVTAVAEVLSSIHAERSPDWRSFQNGFRNDTNALRAFQWLAFGGNVGGVDVRDRPSVRFGLEGLASVGPIAKPLSPRIESLIRSKQDYELWRAASLALKSIGSDATKLGPELKLVLQDPDEHPYVRASAAEALSMLCQDQETRTLVKQMLHDSSAHVRVAAARGLLELKEPPEQVLPTVTPLLQHKLASVRLDALMVLLQMGPAAEVSRSRILELENDGDERIRQAAAKVVGAMNVPVRNQP